MIEEIANRQRAILAYSDGDYTRLDRLLGRVESHIAQNEPEAVAALEEVAAHPAAPDWSQLDWTGEPAPVAAAKNPPKPAKTSQNKPAATAPATVQPTPAPMPAATVKVEMVERLYLGHPSDPMYGQREYL